jgi:hypothetical protein
MTRMRTLLAAAGMPAWVCLAAYGASVQGQLTCGDGNTPATGIAVTVHNASTGRSSPSFTGADGMYYFNLKAGTYTLEIWTSKSSSTPAPTQTINVTEPNTDIPRIKVSACSAQK